MNETLRGSKSASKSVRRTESKEVRRLQLIEAAIESISKHGIGGTTMSTVTEAAGLSLGLVNFHFESKQKLFEETIVYLANEFNEHWKKAYDDAGLSAEEKMLAIVDANFHRSVASRKRLAVWFAFYGEAKRRTAYRNLLDYNDEDRLEVTIKLCQKIIDEGGYNCPPAAQIARTLEGLYDGLSLNILMYPGSYSPADARRQVYAYLAAIFPNHIEMPEF